MHLPVLSHFEPILWEAEVYIHMNELHAWAAFQSCAAGRVLLAP